MANGEKRRRLSRAAAAAAPAVRPFELLEGRVLMTVAAHYYNDGFWGRGDGNRPSAPQPGENAFPAQTITVNRPGDVITTVPQIAFDWGGGSPHPAIRGDNHSTVFVGKIIAPEAGSYEILGFGDDDTHVFVGGQLVSSDPLGHGIDDPRVGGVSRGGGAVAVELTAGAHDLLVVQAEQGGGSGVFLRWITPTMAINGDPAANVPAANLTADNAAPDAPTNFARTNFEADGVTPLPAGVIAFTFTDNSTEELRYELERSTDGVNFTPLPRPAAINSGRITDAGALNGVNYTYRLAAVNFAGRGLSSNTIAATGAQTLPAAPTGLTVTPGSFSADLAFTDNATNETGYQVLVSRTNNIAAATLVGTTGPDATTFTVGNLLPSTPYFFFVRAVNDAGQGTAASASGTTLAPPTRPVPAGTGAYAEFFNVSNNLPNIFADPALTRVDPMINFDFGGGSPGDGVNPDNHSGRWTGRIGVPADFDGDGVVGETIPVTFVSATDDGAFLWVNGETVVFDQTYHGIFNRRADRTVNLTEGQAYPFQYQFFEGGGGSGAFLRVVNPPTGAIVDVPAAAFVSSQRGAVPAPSNLRATQVDAQQATIVFDNENSTAQNYFITLTDPAGATREFVTTPDGSPFTITGLTANTAYNVKVRGYNVEGGLSPESSANFTTLATGAAPAAPSVVRVLARAGATQVQVTDNSYQETGFVFERSVNGGAFVEAGTAGASAPGASGGTIIFTDNGTAAGQSVVYRIRATGLAAPAGSGDSATVTTTAVVIPVPGTGVRKRAYDNIDFTGTMVEANPVPDIEEDYGNGPPDPTLGPDQFSVIFDGYFLAEYTGTYHFGISTDDGASFLLIDPATGQPLLNHQNLGARRGGDFGNPQDRLAPVNLVAGTKYPIEARMVEDGGGANIKLFLSTNGGASYQSVPTPVLFPVVGNEAPTLAPRIQSGSAFGTDRITLNFSDFNFTETGFEIERSPTGAAGSFTPAGTAPAGAGTFTLAGPFTAGTPVFFRLRATGAGGTFSPYSNVVSVTPSNPATETRTDLTLNGTATFIPLPAATDPDLQGLQLTDNVNSQTGTAYLTYPRNVNRDGVISFRFQIPEGNGADGFAFVLQSNSPNAIGGGGGSLGYQGVPQSLAVKFDIYNNINQTGIYVNGEGVADDGSDIGMEIDNGDIYEVTLTINTDGADEDGDGNPDAGTTNDAITVRITNVSNPDGTTPFEQTFSFTHNGVNGTTFDLPALLGGNNAYIGFAGATGGLNAEHNILDFHVYGQEIPLVAPPSNVEIVDVYVRGSTWAQSFKDFVQSSGNGSSTYGVLLPDNAALPTNAQTVSWINTNEIVLRYSGPVTGSGIPTAGTITLDGTRQDYTVTAVTAIDDRTFVLTLDRPLGNIPGGGIDGDKVKLSIPGAGPAGGNFTQVINVLQGDANRDALGRVNAADQGYVKSRVNRTAANPDAPPQASYTIFADVNGDGRVNAADQGAVKSRINDGMPAAAPAGDLFSASRIAEEVLA